MADCSDYYQYTLQINVPLNSYLEEIKRSGLYGKRIEDVMQRLIEDRIRDLIASGFVERIKIHNPW